MPITGGAGAAIAAQYSVSKLYNDPLLRTTISIVAASEGDEPQARANAVSTALLLALVVGVTQGETDEPAHVHTYPGMAPPPRRYRPM